MVSFQSEINKIKINDNVMNKDNKDIIPIAKAEINEEAKCNDTHAPSLCKNTGIIGRKKKDKNENALDLTCE